jgi:5-methylcytosine-specific restriction protein A
MPQRPTTMKTLAIRGAPSRLNAVQPRTLRKTVERGYDAVWEKLRDAFKLANPICKHCLEQDGKAVPMHDVDHIIDIDKRPDLRLDWDNLQSLCKTHHGRKTRASMNANR